MADLRDHASSLRWLVEHGLLGAPEIRLDGPTPTAVPEAEMLARDARARLGIDGPVPAIADVCERFGLYLLVVDRDAGGASMSLDGVGTAVIGGRTDPGQLRSAAAHELGHHLFGVPADDRERLVNAFARAFLLPAPALRQEWPADPDQHRPALVRVAGTYRVAWDLAVQRAADLGLIDVAEQAALAARPPVRGDFLAQLGTVPAEDLTVGSTGAAWKRAVLAAYGKSLITEARTLELLHGAVDGPEDLPLS